MILSRRYFILGKTLEVKMMKKDKAGCNQVFQVILEIPANQS